MPGSTQDFLSAFRVHLVAVDVRSDPAATAPPASHLSALPEARAAAPARVLAVIVTHEPDREALRGLVESLVEVTASVLVVDNSESQAGCVSAQAVAAACGAEAICNPRNLGVAEAQNIGLRAARERGFTHVLLLDQDSVLEADAVPQLLAAFRALRDAGEPVAAVGAAFVDPRTGRAYPFVRLGRLRMRKSRPQPGAVTECDLLISSGCLIALDALAVVGEMDSGLFIDYVDVEWCVRARAAGFKVFGVADARMHHTIGDNSVRVLGRQFDLHRPVRYYYFARNALLFARKPYLDARWRLHLAYRTFGQLALFGLLAKGRRERLPWLLLGLWHGLLGRSGRLGGPEGLAELRPRRESAAAQRVEEADLPAVRSAPVVRD